MVGYKRVEGAVIELEILGPSYETSETGGHMGHRTAKARVIRAYPLPGHPHASGYRSLREPSFVYQVGEIVAARSFDELGNDGIHYFETREAARRY